MSGRDSLWGWLGIALLIEVVGGGLLIGIGLIEDASSAWLVAGYITAGRGGIFAVICVIGIGVSVGMLRYDHLRSRR